MKKIISLIMSFIIILTCCSYAFAKDQNTYDSSISAEQFDVYDIKLNNNYDNNTNTNTLCNKYSLLDLCDEEDTIIFGDNTIKIYVSEVIPKSIMNLKELLEISVLNDGLLYISYETINNETVVLVYDDNGLCSKSIYQKENNKIFNLDNGNVEVINIEAYSMSEELESFINEKLDSGNIEDLYNNENLNIIEDGENLIIEEKIYGDDFASPLSSEFPTSTTDLLNSLKNDFPMYTNTLKKTQNLMCDYLNKKVPVICREDRNSYVRKKANINAFAAGTAIATIASFIGGPTSTAVYILSCLSVGISAADTILTSINLCNSAIYTFKGNRYGLVYDYTKYNDYVLVQSHKSSGEYTGGYDKNGNFTWVISTPANAFSISYDTILNNSIYYYNSDLETGSGKTNFMPQ